MRAETRRQLIRADVRIPSARGQFVDRTAFRIQLTCRSDLRRFRLFDIPQLNRRVADRRQSFAVRFPFHTEKNHERRRKSLSVFFTRADLCSAKRSNRSVCAAVDEVD